MKRILISIFIVLSLLTYSCKKDEVSVNFSNLTSNIWVSDSLLVQGVDASGPGQLLSVFNGEVIFNEDGTGTFGVYEGTWNFAEEETKIVLSSDSLMFPLSTNIEELTNTDLKITTEFPNVLAPENPYDIRMTFKAK